MIRELEVQEAMEVMGGTQYLDDGSSGGGGRNSTYNPCPPGGSANMGGGVPAIGMPGFSNTPPQPTIGPAIPPKTCLPGFERHPYGGCAP